MTKKEIEVVEQNTQLVSLGDYAYDDGGLGVDTTDVVIPYVYLNQALSVNVKNGEAAAGTFSSSLISSWNPSSFIVQPVCFISKYFVLEAKKDRNSSGVKPGAFIQFADDKSPEYAKACAEAGNVKYVLMPGGDRLVQKAIYWYFNVLDDLNPSQSLFNSVFKLTSLKTKITKIMNTHVVNYNKNLNNDLAKAGLSPTRLSFLRTRFEVSAINTTHADGDCFGLVVKPYGKTMADFLINPKTEKSLIEEGKNLYHIAHKSTQAFDIPDEGEETSDIPF